MSFHHFLRNSSDLRFMDYKGTFGSIEDIYKEYPQGGIYGWFCLVNPQGVPSSGFLVYWDKLLREWIKIGKVDMVDILGLSDEDIELLQTGSFLVWNSEEKAFELQSVSLWGKNEW